MSGPDLFDRLLEIDAKLAAKGFPALSPFWKKECRRFLRSGKRRWVVRCGRRAGKSLTLMKLALVFALFAPWTVAPGELAMIPFLSTERREAGARIRQIAAALDALGETYDKREDEVELRSRPLLFRVVTASVRAVSGFTSVFVVCDEVAKWRDEATGANPAAEVFASVIPTMSTVESARIVLASSPWSEVDFHASLFDAGESDGQLVSFAESWVGNPTLTAEGTRAESPSEIVWLREFAAKPSASSSSLCAKDEWDLLVRKGVTTLPPIPGAEHVIALDVGLRNDRTAIVVARKELRAGPDGSVREFLVVVAVVHLVPGLLKRISVEDVVEAVAKIWRTYPGKVYADAHYFDAVGPQLREKGLEVVEVPMTPLAIAARVTALQARLSSQTLDVVDHPELRKEVLGAVVVHHQGGRITCRAPEGRRGLHDDLLAALQICGCPEIFPKLVAWEGEVIVRYGAVTYNMGDRQLDVQPTRFFTKFPDGREVEREPPYGSHHFVRWAQETVRMGGWTPSIERWCRDLGHEPVPGFNVDLLDPRRRTG